MRTRAFSFRIALPAVLMAAACCLLGPLTAAEPSYLPGKFVRADLVTDQTDAARDFYRGLFGWKFRGNSDYLVASNRGRPVAGLIKKSRPSSKAKATPRWFAYLSTTDVDRAAKSVKDGGGRVIIPPADLEGRGRQAVLADPEGALFGIIHSSAGDPPDTEAKIGDWVWIQFLSRNSGKAANFYSKVGGYQIRKDAASGHSDYILSSAGRARATVRSIPSNKSKVQPTWLPFVRVKSIGDSVAKAKQLGGQVVVSPRPELMEGRVAVVADPSGAAIGLMETK
ncbi:VOC family protein [Haloferula chungangensis]|uniref:VOC family protein n=1 Tax=Haloferula chungangensis TaxID=1048331 RepID=A0ABW2L3U5_9BACT